MTADTGLAPPFHRTLYYSPFATDLGCSGFALISDDPAEGKKILLKAKRTGEKTESGKRTQKKEHKRKKQRAQQRDGKIILERQGADLRLCRN